MNDNKLTSLDLLTEDEKKQMAVELLSNTHLKLTLADVAKMFTKGSGCSARKIQEGEQYISSNSTICKFL